MVFGSSALDAAEKKAAHARRFGWNFTRLYKSVIYPLCGTDVRQGNASAKPAENQQEHAWIEVGHIAHVNPEADGCKSRDKPHHSPSLAIESLCNAIRVKELNVAHGFLQ